MPVSVRATLTVTGTVTEPMQQSSKQTLAEVNFPHPVKPGIHVTVISTVTMILMEPMPQFLSLTLAEVNFLHPARFAPWGSGAVTKK